MRIGILTLFHNNNNYGAILQAFALNYKLREFGHEVMTIDYDSHQYGFINKVLSLKKCNNAYNLMRFLYFYMRHVVKKNHESEKKKEAFIKFKQRYIPHTSKVYDEKSIFMVNDLFDVFICGSDMVWYSGYMDISNVYWLNFADENKRKIAYAASVSQKKFNHIQEKQIFDALKTYNAVSVRELSSIDLLKTCSPSKKIQMVLDPVFLIKDKEWKEMFDLKENINDYICIYLLSSEMLDKTKRIVMGFNKKVVIVPTGSIESDMYPKEWEVLSEESPIAFLSTIMNASTVITDSYHGTLFSLIFNKDFYTIMRYSSSEEHDNSRIESLMQLLPIKDHILTKDFRANDLLKSGLDYKIINRLISEKREQSIQFLENSLCEG